MVQNYEMMQTTINTEVATPMIHMKVATQTSNCIALKHARQMTQTQVIGEAPDHKEETSAVPKESLAQGS